MNKSNSSAFLLNTSKLKLSNLEFKRLSDLVQRQTGIRMPQAKKVMLESRLQKRLRQLRIPTFSEYLQYLFSAQGKSEELLNMIDAVTTNKTDFFREPFHFNFLKMSLLPALVNRYQSPPKLTVWSAACSSGEEPYTLAMVLEDFKEKNPKLNYSIYATDISTQVLDIAKKGIYAEERIAPVPPALKFKYLLKSKDRIKKEVRIHPSLRSKISFSRLNLLESPYSIREKMDIIFCRNVFIYFDRETQLFILNQFYKHLKPGGFLFMGHSESLNGLDIPYVQIRPTIYRKTLSK